MGAHRRTASTPGHTVNLAEHQGGAAVLASARCCTWPKKTASPCPKATNPPASQIPKRSAHLARDGPQPASRPSPTTSRPRPGRQRGGAAVAGCQRNGGSPYLIRKRRATLRRALWRLMVASGAPDRRLEQAVERATHWPHRGPASGGTDNCFLKGGASSGLWHWCGDPAGAAALLICEGLRHGCQACTRPRGAPWLWPLTGQLIHVAKALHQARPGRAEYVDLCR